MNLKLFPGMAEHTLRLKAFQDILAARHHIITMLELADIEQDPVERERLINFVVAGGNYAGDRSGERTGRLRSRHCAQTFPKHPGRQNSRHDRAFRATKILPELGQTLSGSAELRRACPVGECRTCVW